MPNAPLESMIVLGFFHSAKGVKSYDIHAITMESGLAPCIDNLDIATVEKILMRDNFMNKHDKIWALSIRNPYQHIHSNRLLRRWVRRERRINRKPEANFCVGPGNYYCPFGLLIDG